MGSVGGKAVRVGAMDSVGVGYVPIVAMCLPALKLLLLELFALECWSCRCGVGPVVIRAVGDVGVETGGVGAVHDVGMELRVMLVLDLCLLSVLELSMLDQLAPSVLAMSVCAVGF